MLARILAALLAGSIARSPALAAQEPAPTDPVAQSVRKMAHRAVEHIRND